MEPTTFDEMTAMLMNRQMIKDVQNILTCEISPRIFFICLVNFQIP